MNIRLSYTLRLFILSLTFLSTEFSYSGEYINGHEHDYLNQVFIDAREDDYKEMMSHYKLMIKKAEESSDTDTRDILLKEARALECAYKYYIAVDAVYETLLSKYINDVDIYHSYCKSGIEDCMQVINDFEKHIKEIDKLKEAELLSYMRRSGFLRTLRDTRPEFFNENSRAMFDEYDTLIFDTLDRSPSNSSEKRDRLEYLNKEEMPKLILSMCDSMKNEVLVMQKEIKRLEELQARIRVKIYPYFLVLEMYRKFSSHYDNLRDRYLRLRKTSI